MAIVLPVLCDCGFQHHGKRPVAASVHDEETACFILHFNKNCRQIIVQKSTYFHL